jgi:hypothetical protein
VCYEAFIFNLLQTDLYVNSTKFRNQASNQNTFGSELILHCTSSRVLAGASHFDVMVHTGISSSAFYCCVYRDIDAISGCCELVMPMCLSEMHDASNKFKEFSLDGRLNGYIGTLDGWLCRIKVPSASDTMA